MSDTALLMTVEPPRGRSVLERHGYAFFKDWWRDHKPGWVDAGWWSMPVREEVADLLWMAPGPDLMLRLHGLDAGRCPADHGEGIAGLPSPGSRAGFPCGCQLVMIAAWRAVTSWAAVAAAGAVVGACGGQTVVVPGDGTCPRVEDPGREDVATALRVSPGAAWSAINRGREMMASPALADLAREGILPIRTVEKLCEELRGLTPADALEVAERFAEQARERVRTLRRMTHRAALKAIRPLIMAAASYRRARKSARQGRRVEMWPGPDGTATLQAVLKEEDCLRLYRRLTALANGLDDPDDTRGADAKRADLLVDLVLGKLGPSSSGVEVNLVVPVEVLLGLSDGLCEIPGLGPIPADAARELAADARWRAWLARADGTIVATSVDTYRPSAAIARLVRARDPMCRMPGCTATAHRCDLDHVVPYPHGETSVANLGPLCRRHHVLKTHLGYRMVPEEQVWQAPSGAVSAFNAA